MRHIFKGRAVRHTLLLPATAMCAAFATSGLAQEITRTDWRMNRTSEVVIVPGVVSPANGDPLAFAYAPPIPDGSAPGWEPAPDPQIIAFKGHNGDEISRLPEGSCLQAFDFVFFDTLVNVPEGAQVSDFSISFNGMDDGSRITIFNDDYPTGTPDMPNGVNNFVAYDQNVTLDMAQFLRAGQNRVVITQVDDCPGGNKLRAAEVVLNGSVIAAPQTGSPAPAPNAGAEGMMDVAYGDVHIRSADGLRFDFQIPGDFFLAGTADSRFIIQERNKISDINPAVTVTVAVAAYVMSDVIEIYLDDDTVLLNGAVLDLGQARQTGFRSYPLPQGGAMQVEVRPNATVYTIYRYPEGHPLYNSAAPQSFQITDPSNVVAATVAVRGGTKAPIAVGLVGVEDGNPSNDLRMRSGEVIARPASQAEINRFGESWRATGEENLFRHRPPAPLAPPPTPVVMAELPEETRTAAATTCLKAGVSEVNLLRDCAYDVAVTGDPAFADVAAQVQASDAAVPDLPPAQSADGSSPVNDIGEAALAAAQAATGVQVVLPEANAKPVAAPVAKPVTEDEFEFQFVNNGLVGHFVREKRYGAIEYNLIFQADGNFCTYTVKDDTLYWCISNDTQARYADTAKIMLTDRGQLVGLDTAGGVLYAFPPKPVGSPIFAELRDDGALVLINSKGHVVWSFTGRAPVANSGQNAPLATGVQSGLPEAAPEPEAALEATAEPEEEPVAEPEPATEALPEGIAGIVTRQQRFSLDGYYMIFQADGNLCVYTEADNRFIWCVNNDPNIRYAETAEVVMTTGGQLMGLDAAGGVLYAYPPEPTGMPSDLFISSEGKVTLANEKDGTVWSFN